MESKGRKMERKERKRNEKKGKWKERKLRQEMIIESILKQFLNCQFDKMEFSTSLVTIH